VALPVPVDVFRFEIALSSDRIPRYCTQVHRDLPAARQTLFHVLKKGHIGVDSRSTSVMSRPEARYNTVGEWSGDLLILTPQSCPACALGCTFGDVLGHVVLGVAIDGACRTP